MALDLEPWTTCYIVLVAAAANPFFSKQAVARLQPMLRFMIEKLCSRIDELGNQAGQCPCARSICVLRPILLPYMRLIGAGIIWIVLISPPSGFKTIKATVSAGPFLKQFPFTYGVIRALPNRIVGAMNPGMLMLLQWQKVRLINSRIRRHCREANSTFYTRKSKRKPKKLLTETTNPPKANLTWGSTRLLFTPFLNLISFLKKNFN